MKTQEELIAMKGIIEKQNERIQFLEMASESNSDNFRHLFEIIGRLAQAISKMQRKQNA